MNDVNLIKGIMLIKKQLPKGSEVTAIQFEDGSGKKFNYQVDGGKWQFIDLTEEFKKTGF